MYENNPSNAECESNMADRVHDVFCRAGGACFQQRRTEVIQASAHMNEVEFHRAGSTIQAISDMHRSQSNGIKVTIGA